MPADSLLVLIAVAFVFLLFAIVLAWIDHSTTQWLRARAAEKHAPETERPHKRAA